MTTESHVRFYLNGPDAEAIGYPAETGFIVEAGSIARRESVPSLTAPVIKVRDQLIADKVLEEQEGQLRFTQKRSSSEAMLSKSKRDEIIAKSEQLISEGKLYTQTQLQHYYAVFRERFGPDVLRSLDGEALLTFMHDHSNRDSLVYWLEFKSDEEFDTRRFGSISGGSGLKFRIFRRKETGLWQAGSEHNKTKPQDITIERAIEIAREHRDQLLEGAKLLDELVEDATDDAYASLQDQMDELAPDVSRLAWGHKYFSLLFPDKIDDYHLHELQRFHLLKLLQLPPEDHGRYIGAGRFVSAAHDNRMGQAWRSILGDDETRNS